MSLIIVTPPTEEPVTLEEAKTQCRVDIDDDDDLIASLIVAARQWCEKHDWRAYITQTIDYRCNQWPADDYFELPRPPLQAVNSVKYYDVDNAEYTLDPALYDVDYYNTPGGFYLHYNQNWPATQLRLRNAIKVNYTAGYGAAEDVPETIKQAMLLLIGHWYENRENSTVGAVNRSIEFGVTALLSVTRAARF